MAVNLPIIIDMGISKHCVEMCVLGAELVVQTDSSSLTHRVYQSVAEGGRCVY